MYMGLTFELPLLCQWTVEVGYEIGLISQRFARGAPACGVRRCPVPNYIY